MPPIAHDSDPWLEYRRCTRLLLVAALGGLTLFILSCLPARALHSAKPLYLGLFAFLSATALAATRLLRFPCPRCGEPFIQNHKTRDVFTRHCLHCRLPRGAKGD